MPDIITHTNRITLRLPENKDAPEMIKLFNQQDFIDNIRDKDIKTIAAAEHEVQVMHKHQREHGFSLYMMDTDSETAIGVCGLVKRPELDIPDIGFAIRTEFQNQGFVTEAGKAVLKHSFEQLNLKTIAAIAKPDNLPSIAVINKMGFDFIDGIQLNDHEPQLKYFELQGQQYKERYGVSND